MTPRDARSIAEIAAALSSATGAKLKRLVTELADDDRAGVREAVRVAQAREKARVRERDRIARLYLLEAQLREQGCQVVAGVDEVGRGALAGPLTAAACVLPPSPRVPGLNDSKLLTPARRAQIAEQIKEVAVCWAVSHVPAAELDNLGITAALRRAMGRSVAGLELDPDHVVIDGLPMRVFATETAVVGGDGKVAAIAAASILAKVARDTLMTEFATHYPAYCFQINKGYGTPEHLAAIDAHGLTPLHRRSFMPCGGTERLF